MTVRDRGRSAAAGGFLIVTVLAMAVSAAEVASVPPSAMSATPGMPGDQPMREGAPNPSSASVSAPPALPPGEYTYNASGRRDPFAAIIKDGKGNEENHQIPPLQRLSLTELNLIGIVWGGFGYSAMVQAPDGRGYTVRPGTRIGPNNGVVSSITENAIVVQERFTDVYGNKQVREYVKLLHAKEGTE